MSFRDEFSSLWKGAWADLSAKQEAVRPFELYRQSRDEIVNYLEFTLQRI